MSITSRLLPAARRQTSLPPCLHTVRLARACMFIRNPRPNRQPIQSQASPSPYRHLSTSRRLCQGPNVQAVAGTAAQEDGGVNAPDYLSEGELQVFNKLKQELEPTKLEVQDISGGCGSMYGLDIVSSKFKGLSVIKQHQLVNKVLKEEIGKWHGVQLKTKAPAE